MTERDLEHRIVIERIALGTALERMAAGDFERAALIVKQSRDRMRQETEQRVA